MVLLWTTPCSAWPLLYARLWHPSLQALVLQAVHGALAASVEIGSRRTKGPPPGRSAACWARCATAWYRQCAASQAQVPQKRCGPWKLLHLQATAMSKVSCPASNVPLTSIICQSPRFAEIWTWLRPAELCTPLAQRAVCNASYTRIPALFCASFPPASVYRAREQTPRNPGT